MKRPVSGQATLTADTPVAIPNFAATAGRTYYITGITLTIGTHVNAKAIFVRDTAGTPVVAATFRDLTKAAGVDDNFVVTFPGKGFACTAAKGVEVVGEASGHSDAKVVVSGYYLS